MKNNSANTQSANTQNVKSWRTSFNSAMENAFYLNNNPKDFGASDIQLLDAFAKVAVRRRLTSAFIFFLEFHRPLNFLTSQVLVFAHPLLDMLLGSIRPFAPWLFTKEQLEQLAIILENRASIPMLIDRIHFFEDEYIKDPAGFKFKYPKATDVPKQTPKESS